MSRRHADASDPELQTHAPLDTAAQRLGVPRTHAVTESGVGSGVTDSRSDGAAESRTLAVTG